MKSLGKELIKATEEILEYYKGEKKLRVSNRNSDELGAHMLAPDTPVTYKGKRFSIVECINSSDKVDVKKQGERYLIYSVRQGLWSVLGSALRRRTN